MKKMRNKVFVEITQYMKKVEEWLIENKFPIISVLFCFSIYIAYKSLDNWLLFITFVAVIWYTLETAKLRKITQWGIELSNRPWLTIELEENKGNGDIYISNVGKGIAIKANYKVFQYDNTSAVIDFIPIETRKNITSTLAKPLNTPRVKFVLELEYEDITKKKYFSHYELLNKKIRLLGHGIS